MVERIHKVKNRILVITTAVGKGLLLFNCFLHSNKTNTLFVDFLSVYYGMFEKMSENIER